MFAVPLETVDAGPADILPKIPPGPEFDAARKALISLPDPDDLLAARFREQRTVVPVTLGVAGGRKPEVKARFIYRGQFDPYRAAPAFDSGAAQHAPSWSAPPSASAPATWCPMPTVWCGACRWCSG